jgi:hypothetical protein
VDIVLPLLATDLERYLRLQRPTFERFYRDLGTTWMFVRPDEQDAIERATSGLDGVRVMSDQQLVPELALARAVKRSVTRNWYQQQLIKLAAVARAETAFVLVLDGDVIAVREVCDTDLLVDGRALRPREPAATHPTWIAESARALGMAPLDYSAAVTPSVLAPSAVRLLADYAGRAVRARKRIVRMASLVPGLRGKLTTWRGRLLGALPWTEYQLYDTFLVRTGQFERFHRYSEDPLLSGNSVWESGEFEGWTPGPLAEGPTFFFSVVQSALAVSLDVIEERLRRAGLL